jgi:hypothetical protein
MSQYQESKKSSRRNRLGSVDRLKALRRDLGIKYSHFWAIEYLFDYSDEQGKKRAVEKIMQSRLEKSTDTISRYEYLAKRTILKYGLFALYEPLGLPLPIGRGKGTVYTPDFFFPYHYIKDRPVVVETHGSNYLTVDYLKKLKSIGELYNLHMVLVTDSLPVVRPEKVIEYVDEFYVAQHKHLHLDLMISEVFKRAQLREENGVERIVEKLKKDIWFASLKRD